MAWKRLGSLAVLAGLALLLVTPPPSLAVDVDEWAAALVTGFNTEMNQGNIDTLVVGWTDDSVRVHPMMGTLRGKEGQRQFFQGLYDGFVDQKITLHRSFTQGSMIALEWTWDATHRESGKPITLDEVGIFEVDSTGKIRYLKQYFDSATVSKQLE